MFFSSIPKLLLKINEDFSLYDLLGLLKKCPKNSELYLKVEGRWHFLHTITGIKQIQKETDEREVKLFIGTKDEIGRKMVEASRISIFNTPPDDVKDFYEELIPERSFDENKIGEAFSAQEFEIVKVIKKGGEEKWGEIQNKFEGLSLKNKILVGIAGIFSIAVFSFLIAIIAPSAEVEIIAEKKIINSVVNANFIKTERSFSENLEDKGNNFYLYPIDIRFEDEIIFPVLSKIFEGQNSFGDAIIYNNYPEPITLKNGTKLQTEDGILFLTKHYVRIPGIQKKKDKDGKEFIQPGQALVNLIANDLDIYQEVIGSRGNIQPKKLIVPGLTSYMQRFIWAETQEPFRGGTTRWRKEVQQSDLDAAKDKINSILYEKAKTKLIEFINEQNKNIERKITLFKLDNYIKNEISKIEFPSDILGKKLDSFFVKGEMLISAYVFHEKDFYKFVIEHLEKKSDPRMKIEKMDFDTMTFRKFEETSSEIRVAVDLKGRQSFYVDNKSEDGNKFQEKIRDYLRGLRKEEAIKYLLNQPEINQVNIKIWPLIKKHMPLVKDNIKIIEK